LTIGCRRILSLDDGPSHSGKDNEEEMSEMIKQFAVAVLAGALVVSSVSVVPTSLGLRAGLDELEEVKPRATAGLDELEEIKPRATAGLDELEEIKPRATAGLDELEEIKPRTMAGLDELEEIKPRTMAGLDELEDVNYKHPVV
jgi:hypothetical protein